LIDAFLSVNCLQDITLNSSVKRLLEQAGNAIDSAVTLRFQHGKLEARLLFEFISGKNYTWIVLNKDEAISIVFTQDLLQAFAQVLSRRLSGVPLAYITRKQAFWDLELKVDECTLIPRQDTETVVETALALSLPKQASVLDLGSGTGAIALALAKERPNWEVSGVDKIDKAVELAKENAKLNEINVRFYQSDWFSFYEGKDIKFDLIVSNPPYVEEDSEYLKEGDLRFEPLSALVAKDNGLRDIKYIVKHAQKYLKEKGVLILEHGSTQSEMIRNLLKDAGFVDVKSQDDLHNLPRITPFSYTHLTLPTILLV